MNGWFTPASSGRSTRRPQSPVRPDRPPRTACRRMRRSPAFRLRRVAPACGRHAPSRIGAAAVRTGGPSCTRSSTRRIAVPGRDHRFAIRTEPRHPMTAETIAVEEHQSVDPEDHGEAFWRACTEQLRDELTPQQYSAWIKPLTAAIFDPSDRRLRIGAPNRFKLDWVKDQFAGRIETIAQRFYEGPVQLELYLDAKAPDPVAPRPASSGHHDASSPGTSGSAPTGGDDRAADASRGNGASSNESSYGSNGSSNDHGRSPGSAERSRARPGADLRHLRDRQGQPARARGREPGRRQSRHLVQPAVPVRRRRPRQDPPDPGDRQPDHLATTRRRGSATSTRTSTSPTS